MRPQCEDRNKIEWRYKWQRFKRSELYEVFVVLGIIVLIVGGVLAIILPIFSWDAKRSAAQLETLKSQIVGEFPGVDLMPSDVVGSGNTRILVDWNWEDGDFGGVYAGGPITVKTMDQGQVVGIGYLNGAQIVAIKTSGKDEVRVYYGIHSKSIKMQYGDYVLANVEIGIAKQFRLSTITHAEFERGSN